MFGLVETGTKHLDYLILKQRSARVGARWRSIGELAAQLALRGERARIDDQTICAVLANVRAATKASG
jgi:hypothetical protein